MDEPVTEPCPRKNCPGNVINWGKRSFFCKKCSLNFGRDEDGILWGYDQGKRIYISKPTSRPG